MGANVLAEQKKPVHMKDTVPGVPYNLEAEQGLLGAFLYDNTCYDRVGELRDVHFYAAAHQDVFRAIKSKIESGERATPVTMTTMLLGSAALKEVGGEAYLADLLGGCISPFNAPDYAQTLRDLYYRRNLLMSINGVHDMITAGAPLDDIVSSAEKSIFSIRQGDLASYESASDAWGGTVQWIEDLNCGKVRPVRSGLHGLDKIIQGFFPGRLYIIAARPGMGKTALALNIAQSVAAEADVLDFSFEMTKQELSMRIAARESGICIQAQTSGRLSNDDIIKLANVQQPRRLYIYDRAGVDVDHIAMVSRRFCRAKQAGMIVIDYLGLVRGDPRMQKVHQIEQVTSTLKTLAKELNVPIILLSQLSRAIEARDDKRPTLADLRDSGAIEQDADVVMFVYRPEYYADRDEPKRNGKESQESYSQRLSEYLSRVEAEKGKAQIIVAKNRQGRMNTAYVNFDGKRQLFFEDQ